MRVSALSGFLAFLVAGCCCDDDDYHDCHYEEECYWDACCGWYCYDVNVCFYAAAGMVDADPADLDFSAIAVPQGDETLAIGVRISGRYADGETLLSVRLHGEQGSGFRRQSRMTTWWFYGLPAASAREIEVRLVGQDLSVTKALPAPESEQAEPILDLGELAQAATGILDVPDAPCVGAEMVVRAPERTQLPGVSCTGLALEIVRPDSSETGMIVLAGEKTAFTLDLPGRWMLRPTVLADSTQGFPSEDAAGLDDVMLEVAP